VDLGGTVVDKEGFQTLNYFNVEHWNIDADE
jgi:hypothetical protein